MRLPRVLVFPALLQILVACGPGDAKQGTIKDAGASTGATANSLAGASASKSGSDSASGGAGAAIGGNNAQAGTGGNPAEPSSSVGGSSSSGTTGGVIGVGGRSTTLNAGAPAGGAMVTGGAPGAAGGTVSAAGQASIGGTVNAGGGAVSGGTAGTATTGTLSTGGVSVSGSSTAVSGYFESSDGIETVNNNDRDHTLPLTPTASIWAMPGDQDWFYVDAPSDGRAHIISITVKQAAAVRVWVTAVAQVDFSQIGTVLLSTGVSSTVYVSVGAGTRTLLSFSNSSGTGRVDLSYTMTAEMDDYEPNDSRTAAAIIPLNQDISAQLVTPYASASVGIPDDWYQTTLVAGTATFRLVKSLDNTSRLELSRADANGNITQIAVPDAGVTGTWSFPVVSSGTYYFRVRNFSALAAFGNGAEPTHMAEVYTFRIEQ